MEPIGGHVAIDFCDYSQRIVEIMHTICLPAGCPVHVVPVLLLVKTDPAINSCSFRSSETAPYQPIWAAPTVPAVIRVRSSSGGVVAVKIALSRMTELGAIKSID